MPADYRKEKIRVTIQEAAEEKEHFHQDIELLYVLEGTLSVMVGSVKSEMLPEDILVINAEKELVVTERLEKYLWHEESDQISFSDTE